MVVEFVPRSERLCNNPRLEWVFQLQKDLPPARLKRLIVQMASDEVGFLTKEESTIAIDALGLRGA
jgi:hypothetical protein